MSQIYVIRIGNMNLWPVHRWTACSLAIHQTFNHCFYTLIKPRRALTSAIKRTYVTSSVERCREEINSKSNQYFSDTAKNLTGVNYYTTRTHTCGELRSADIGKEVTLCGWVEYIRMNKFILLRDAYGVTQIIFHENNRFQSDFNSLYLESTVCVTGVVAARPESQIKKNLDTGEIEVCVKSFQILSHAISQLPFHIRNYSKAAEKLLYQYRYLALRFPVFQRNLRLRSDMIFKMREFLIKHRGFVEVETPTLFKKTPGGAQEFIVPTSEKNKFYSLVQSPQQLKQLLMVGSVDRYFQIARCYRDEGINTERQPEFTQLDIELSFTDSESILRLTEEVLAASWPSTETPLKIPFPVMRYDDAINNYGSDKPCLIDKFRINPLGKYVHSSDKNFFMFVIPDGQCHFTELNSQFIELSTATDVTIYTLKVPTVEKFCQSLSKTIPGFDVSTFQIDVSVKSNDLVVVAVGPNKTNTLKMLGSCRHQTINFLDLIQKRNRDGVYDCFWIVDFPLVELNAAKEFKSTHHPFTQPHPDDLSLIPNDILKVRSLAYDLIINGSEVGGGSIRIHNAEMQRTILKLLKLDETHFSHLLHALTVGCPPHGGIALGLDRLVAILCNCKSIKDVIAFPKGKDGQDLMIKCPSDVPVEDKIRYHIDNLSTDTQVV